MKNYFLSVLTVLIAGLAMARSGAAQTGFESAQVTFTEVDSVRAYIERHTISRSEEGFTQRLAVSGTGTTVFSGRAGSLSGTSTRILLRLALGRVYSLRTGNPNVPSRTRTPLKLLCATTSRCEYSPTRGRLSLWLT